MEASSWRTVLPDVSESARGLVGHLLELNPRLRWTAAQALQHEFFLTAPFPLSREEMARLLFPLES
jgi:serine/threonine protein kinase